MNCTENAAPHVEDQVVFLREKKTHGQKYLLKINSIFDQSCKCILFVTWESVPIFVQLSIWDYIIL